MPRIAMCIPLIAIACAAQPGGFFQKGVNFTAEGPDYTSPTSFRVLLELKDEYGVTAVALVPYGFASQRIPRLRWNGPGTWENDEAVSSVARQARAIGLKVMLKPHVWVRPGWPGDLDFPDPADREQWFHEYGRFVEHYAKLATRLKADIFCIGNEFGKLTRYDREWRALIQRARSHYKGPIVYAALQGPEFEQLTFWDALDYIGLNNYYPLPDDLSTDAVLRKVEAVQRRFGKPVIFPEAGFTSLEAPHRAPWDETRRKISLEEQARCYEALLKAFWNKPWFKGLYWWKIGSDGYGGPSDGSHTPWRKPAMDVVKKWYTR
jgi:hypothetical protein